MERKGIDVSKYQGTIDWNKVAADGVQFAFIRVGWAGYEGGIDEGFDPYFDANMKGAIAAGIPVGAYVYSYCKSADAARRAAREAAAKCAPYQLSWPLAIDIEDATTYKGFSKRDNSVLVAAFLDEVRKLGYQPMYYTYTNFAASYLDLAMLAGCDLWLADYRGSMGIDGASIWQYSSDGAVDGIAGRVDMNIAYKNYAAKEEDGMMKFLEVFGDKNCQCFTAPDVNKVDTGYNGGTLKSGSFYPVMADAGQGADGFHWLRVFAGGKTRYAVLLDDRCRITPLSAGDAVNAVAAQVTTGDTAALEQQISQLEGQVTTLTARATTAEAKAAQAQGIADGYLARIKAAQVALEG